MKPKRKTSSPFLCFGVTDSSDDDRSTGSSIRTRDPAPTLADSGDDQEILRPRRGRLHRRILSQLIRSASLGSTPDRSRKVRQDPNLSLARNVSDLSDEISMPESCRKSSDTEDRKANTIFTSSSSSSSSSTPSSLSSSSSFPATEPKLRRKITLPRSDLKEPTPEPRNYGYATGLCFLLLSLSVTVFWGRLCAILWTSTCLYFVRRRNADVMSPRCDGAAVESPELRSKRWGEYEKKKVVLDGLLERNRRV